MDKYKVAKLIAESGGAEYMNLLTPFSGEDLRVSILEYELAQEIWLVKFRMQWYANILPVDWFVNFFLNKSKNKHGNKELFYVTGILEAKKNNLSKSKLRITKECDVSRNCRASKMIGKEISIGIILSD